MKQVNFFGFTHSGSTYLLNILFELGICIHHGAFNWFWKELKNGSLVINPSIKSGYAEVHPQLDDHESFRFAEPLRVKFDHTLPAASELQNLAILGVRDPRDVMSSSYHRVGIGRTFSEYLREPRRGDSGYALPGSLECLPAEMWATYNARIRSAYRQEQLLIVRFEDIKHDPIGETQRVLKHIGVNRHDQEIVRAIEASSFDRLQARVQKKDSTPDILRKGKIGDWKTVFTESDLKTFEGMPSFVAHQFGYEIL